MMANDPVEAISLLGEPVRRQLYEYVFEQREPVSREEAASAVGIKRSLAAFHLDKLAEEGLLEVEFKRLSHRKGPGAGRPSKLYKRSGRQIQVSLPRRDYELAAGLFAQALNEGSGNEALHAAASSFGGALAEEIKDRTGRRRGRKSLLRTTEEVLRDRGFEPFHDSDGTIRLRNCPFSSLSRDYTDLVCGMNVQIMRSLVRELGLEPIEAHLEPRPGMCCVAFRKPTA
jgi:predicted ArsR family transcriptional regulator